MFNDSILMYRRHGRVLLPFILITFLVGMIKVFFSETLIVIQTYSIANMLVSVLIFGYSMLYLNDLIGLGRDRLILLNPKSKFSILLSSFSCLLVYMLLNFTLSTLTEVALNNMSFVDFITALIERTLSIGAGFGLFLLITILAKKTQRRNIIKFLPWMVLSLITILLTAVLMKLLEINYSNEIEWIIGVTLDKAYEGIYVGMIPINIKLDFSYEYVMLMNGSIAALTWLIIRFLLEKVKYNYLELV